MPTLRSALPLALAFALLAAGPAAGAQAAERPTQLYVSLGDSYAVGYQPISGGGVGGPGRATKNGYANQLLKTARGRGYRYRLVNFGCGGETTASILERRTACPAPAADGPRYTGRTQADAATRFLRRNRGKVGLITVSIGGNDVTACAAAPDPVACVNAATKRIERNVAALGRRLRAAAGPDARIVGLTYPDVILGLFTTGQERDQELARQSVVAFQALINPALKKAYATVRGRFVDVTRATDAYVPFEQTTTLAPYGTIPVAVARACELSYFCSVRDIHLRTQGYRLMADLIAKTLPRRRQGR